MKYVLGFFRSFGFLKRRNSDAHSTSNGNIGAKPIPINAQSTSVSTDKVVISLQKDAVSVINSKNAMSSPFPAKKLILFSLILLH